MATEGFHSKEFNELLKSCLGRVGDEPGHSSSRMGIHTIHTLKRFSELAKSFLNTTESIFKVCKSKDTIEMTAAGTKLIKLIRGAPDCVDSVYVHEPYTELALEMIRSNWLSRYFEYRNPCAFSIHDANFLNSCADKAREEARSRAFQVKLNSYHRPANKNYKSLIKYERALFSRYSRLLAVRVDLYYKKEFCKVGQDVALRHRKRFFDNARSNKIFKDMVGYITKLEHGVERGFHFHCIFFFDGSKVREDITQAQRVGEYWQTAITNGMGSYYNCNYVKEEYRRSGIGVITHSDSVKRDNLKLVLVYLTKTDIYMKLAGEGRSLTKGITPSSSSGRGRPRKTSTSNKEREM